SSVVPLTQANRTGLATRQRFAQSSGRILTRWPTCELTHFRPALMREGRLELPPLAGLDPKSSASANSATRAMERSDVTRISRPAATDCKIRGELCPRSWL